MYYLGIKKAGKSLNPDSRPWTAQQEDWRNAHAEKQREHQPFIFLLIRSVQVLNQEEKPMRFQYVWDEDTKNRVQKQIFCNFVGRSMYFAAWSSTTLNQQRSIDIQQN